MGKGERTIVIEILDDKDEVSADELDDHILCLEAARSHLDLEWTEALGALDSRRLHKVFGYPSAVAYLKDRCRMAGGRAHRYVSIARAARRFRSTFLSWKHRQISTDQAQQLFRASEQLPDRYPDAENVLLEIVGDTPEETRRILDYWRHSVDEPGVVIENELQLQRRRLDYTRKANGMIEGDFALTETAGEAFVTALDAVMPPPNENDERTPSQRRHDGFEDLSRSFLEGTASPEVGLAGGLHETEDGPVLSVDTIRQLACDASLSRIVLGPKSEILDVGRKTRVIPAGLRRAVIARDRHCTAPGCGRSARWCDVHHIVFWADGGETVLDNLCLLCRYHHTLTHKQQLEDLDIRKQPAPVGGRRPT